MGVFANMPRLLPPLADANARSPLPSRARPPVPRAENVAEDVDARIRRSIAERALGPVQAKSVVNSGYEDLIAEALAPAPRAPDTTGLPAPVRAKMESALGADFTDVRVHPDSARAVELGAQAFTQGNEIHVAPGNWAPETTHGQALLGHELWHVVQQRAGRVQATAQLAGTPLNDAPALEVEADAMAARAAGWAPPSHASWDYGKGEAGGGQVPRSGGHTSVQRKVTFGSLPKSAIKGQETSTREIIEHILGGDCSEGLRAMLLQLKESETSHLVVDFLPASDAPEGKSGAKTYGHTGIRVGDGLERKANLIQEQLFTDPTPLFAEGLSLTIHVTLYMNDPAEIAVTLLHELELHAIPASALLQRLDTIRKVMRNDADKIIGTILQYMAKPDEHANIVRAESFVESGAQLREACAKTVWESWANRIFDGICADACEQLTCAELAARMPEGSIERIKHLSAFIDAHRGQRALPPALEQAHKLPYPWKNVTSGAQKRLSEKEILDLVATATHDRKPLETIIEELATEHGVPRTTTIELYNREIAPQLFEWAPKRDVDLTFLYMSQSGVPAPITAKLMESQSKKGGSSSKSGRRLSQVPLKIPSEQMFWTAPSTEGDWTPITNNYVPIAVLNAHEQLAPKARILVDGFLMQVWYTNTEVRGASELKGSKHGKYMVLRMTLVGG